MNPTRGDHARCEPWRYASRHLTRPRAGALAIFAAAVLTLTLAACAPGMMGGRMGPGMMGGGGGPPPETTPAPTVTPGGSETVSFQRDVAPILTGRCVVCHGGNGGLWLDSYETIMLGGDTGPAIAPGDPAGSLILGRITGDIQPRMPLNLPPLNESQIATIRTWIREGAQKN